MSAVTTGLGVSGTLADELESVVETLRANTRQPRWRLHMQRSQTGAYSLRVYAPDGCSHEYSVATLNALHDIRAILAGEAKSWEVRVRPILVATEETAS